MSTDVYEDNRAIAVTKLGLEKVKRADVRLSGSLATCLAQNLQWRQAATRKIVPTKRALMPPTIAMKVLSERSFSSAWRRFMMISIPRTENPIASLPRLIRVSMLCRVCRLSK